MFLLFAPVSDKPEVFLPKYSQTAILHAAHFRRVVNTNKPGEPLQFEVPTHTKTPHLSCSRGAHEAHMRRSSSSRVTRVETIYSVGPIRLGQINTKWVFARPHVGRSGGSGAASRARHYPEWAERGRPLTTRGALDGGPHVACQFIFNFIFA